MDLFDAPFYWGRIARQDAEGILNQVGLKDGLYLIREKCEEAGSYVITLCFSTRFYHYRIDRLLNGNVTLSGSYAQEKTTNSNHDNRSHSLHRHLTRSALDVQFPGPMELINYFQKHADPLVTKLSIPCQRPNKYNFIQFWCVPLLTPELYMTKILQEASSTDLEIPIKDKLTNKRYIYERRILKVLHENELWFHSRISRQEAEVRLKNAGGKTGLFLVRERAGDQRLNAGYTISLCYQREYQHYIIQKTSNGSLQVASGSKSVNFNQFGSLVQLIDYYHRNHQDLGCSLQYPCARPGGSVRIVPLQIFLEEADTSSMSTRSSNSTFSSGNANFAPFDFNDQNSRFVNDPNHNREPTSVTNMFIDGKYLIFGDKLGEGHFGEVYSGKLIGNHDNNNGVAKHNLQRVAIKCLKQTQHASIRQFYDEGERMLSLDHPNIIKIFGICKNEHSICLVLELCPYGAMNIWLRSNKTFRMKYILNHMYQVSDGMNYLHERNIIHRDLALRNILIMSKTVCKISDFGLSRVLEENAYYQIGQNHRLPSMWYPPEVLETQLFHSQIDIWSFGITLWEATSYGETPYKRELDAMTSLSLEPLSQKLLKFLRTGYRLKRPLNCPSRIYDLMLKCWDHDKHNRPSFAWIKHYLSIYSFS